MDNVHPPSDDANPHGADPSADAGAAADEAEATAGSSVESEPVPTLNSGDDARSRLAGDRSDVDHGTETPGDSTPVAEGEALLERAFPEGDDQTSPGRLPTGDVPLYRADVADAMRSVDAVDRLLTLGRQCAEDGDWSGVRGVLDACDTVDPTRQDLVRAVGTYHAVKLAQPDIARDFAGGMAPGQAQDGWIRYAAGEVDLPQHRVGRYDGLWGVAEQYLGDGRRWHEIRDINVGRPQPDGSRLAADGQDIRQDWMLVLPPDAERNE